MKKIISFFTIAVICFVLMCACSSKQDPIDDLETLSVELENNCENYSQKDWSEVAEKLSSIEEDMNNYDYTDDELRQIGKLKAKCYGTILRFSAKIMKSQIHNAKMQFEGASEEIESTINDVNKEFENEFNDVDE